MKKTPKTHDMKSLCELANESKAGIVVTAFPTRDGRWRARLDVDGFRVYVPDVDSLAELFEQLAAASGAT